jgi:hypothetical protein
VEVDLAGSAQGLAHRRDLSVRYEALAGDLDILGVELETDEAPPQKNENYTYDHKAVRGPNDRNLRSVWDINTVATREAHFATYPPRLVEIPLKGRHERSRCAVAARA